MPRNYILTIHQIKYQITGGIQMLYENYIDRMKNYHDLKESIGIDVVNLSDNILYLKDKCYTSFLDLAIVYYIAPNSHQKFWLPKNVFKKWSITPELL